MAALLNGTAAVWGAFELYWCTNNFASTNAVLLFYVSRLDVSRQPGKRSPSNRRCWPLVFLLDPNGSFLALVSKTRPFLLPAQNPALSLAAGPRTTRTDQSECSNVLAENAMVLARKRWSSLVPATGAWGQQGRPKCSAVNAPENGGLWLASGEGSVDLTAVIGQLAEKGVFWRVSWKGTHYNPPCMYKRARGALPLVSLCSAWLSDVTCPSSIV